MAEASQSILQKKKRRDTNQSPAGGSAKNNNKGRGICWLKRINFSLLDNTKDRNIVC